MGRRRRPDSTRARQAKRIEEMHDLADWGLTPTQIARVLGQHVAGVKHVLGRDANRGRARRDGAA